MYLITLDIPSISLDLDEDDAEVDCIEVVMKLSPCSSTLITLGLEPLLNVLYTSMLHSSSLLDLVNPSDICFMPNMEFWEL